MKEYGNAIPWTKKYEVLAQTNERRAVVRILSDDHAKVYDKAVENEFDQCMIRYVGTATDGGVFTTNGTATATCTSSLNLFHVKQIVDYMYQTMRCAPWDGDNYMAICSTDAKRGIYDDVEDILKYTKYPASGEFGRYYDCRFVKTNHALSNAIGNGSAYGEAYFFGAGGGPVLRGIADKLKIVPKELTDFGRSRGLAWLSLEAFKIYYQGDPDNNIVKYDSA